MKNKKEALDNNKTIEKLLKENNTKEEIANEIHSNKKIADVLGDRLAKKKHFPPC
ncbi:hypothetical protein [Romboutsia maritimum]|uniref:hypothetical protein n=1 Tax=Romboutsia maritimum TaxID=2020948 RepID=UPI001314F2BD|nr:hypothetical protein [Romboutsia maritimum]